MSIVDDYLRVDMLRSDLVYAAAVQGGSIRQVYCEAFIEIDTLPSVSCVRHYVKLYSIGQVRSNSLKDSDTIV